MDQFGLEQIAGCRLFINDVALGDILSDPVEYSAKMGKMSEAQGRSWFVVSGGPFVSNAGPSSATTNAAVSRRVRRPRDPGSGTNRFGPNESAVLQLIRQAATMDFDQLSCADSILDEMNGPTGLRKPWRDAQLGLSRIKSFRQEPADRANRAGAGAVMIAVAAIAKDPESSAAIMADWDLCKENKTTLFRAFIRAPEAERVLQGHLVESFGRKGAEVVNGARWAVSISAEVLVVWDLASVNGPFTVAHRDFLMKPWLSVFDLPDGL